jgi:hypothetical protein
MTMIPVLSMKILRVGRVKSFLLIALRDWIVAEIAPRMTTANTLGRQRSSRHRTMFAQRVHGINRASGSESATAGGTKKEGLRRRNGQAIDANRQNENMLERVHGFNF